MGVSLVVWGNGPVSQSFRVIYLSFEIRCMLFGITLIDILSRITYILLQMT
jgi:hypothetical protein